MLYAGNGAVRQEFSIVLTACPAGRRADPGEETSQGRRVPLENAGRYKMGQSMALRLGHYADGRR